jgi:hypothetical protein
MELQREDFLLGFDAPDCDRSDVFSRSRLLILGDYDALIGEILAQRELLPGFSIFLLYQRTSACPCMTFAFSLRRRYRLNERTNGDYTLNFLPDKVPPPPEYLLPRAPTHVHGNLS